MKRLTALADTAGWTRDQLRAADAEYEARARELLEISEDKMSNADLDELKACNDALEAIRTVQPHPGHPNRRGRSSRPGHHGGGGFGQAVIDGLSSGDRMFAVIDGTSGGTAAPSFFDPQLRELPSRRLFLRSILGAKTVNTDRVDYVRQTVQTHAAAAVAAGGVKPTSTYTVERISADVRVIAHVSEAIDRSLLSDFDALSSFIEDQLRIGVLLEEEDQLLNGSGVAPNLEGILSTAGIQAQARGADPTPDAIAKAMTKIRNEFFEPTALVIHPDDWQDVRLLRTADGDYIWGSPSDPGAETIWGLQVVTTPALAAGTALVGAFATGATVYDRQAARVTFAETGLSDVAGEELFTKNEVRFRGESRIGFAVAFPAAFCTITGV